MVHMALMQLSNRERAELSKARIHQALVEANTAEVRKRLRSAPKNHFLKIAPIFFLFLSILFTFITDKILENSRAHFGLSSSEIV